MIIDQECDLNIFIMGIIYPKIMCPICVHTKLPCSVIVMSMMKMRGPIYVIFCLKNCLTTHPDPTGTRTFLQVPDPSRPEVKKPYPSDPSHGWSNPL